MMFPGHEGIAMIKRPTNIPPEPLSEQRQRFEACLRRRNRGEFAAGAVAMVLLIGWGAVGLSQSTNVPDTIAVLGMILVAAGLGVTLWHLHQHAAVQRQEACDADRKVAFIRLLRRECELLRSVWAWYIGPVLPGFLLVWGGMLAGGSIGVAIIGIVITAIGFAWIAGANLRAATEFDHQLRDIERVADVS
jgi:hypothetical protein